VSEQLLRTEIGYAGATAVLALALGVVYRRGRPDATARRRGEPQAASTARAIAR
jgi:hypothetical protein